MRSGCGTFLWNALLAAGLWHGGVSGFASGPASAVKFRSFCSAAPRMAGADDGKHIHRAVYTIRYRVGGKRHGEAYFGEFYEVKADGLAVTNRKTGVLPGGPFVPDLSQEQARERDKSQVTTAWLCRENAAFAFAYQAYS